MSSSARPIPEATSSGTVYFGEWKTGTVWLHLVSPVIGFLIITYVLFNADVHAKVGGIAWLMIGVVILVGLRLAGRAPELNLAV